MIMHFFTLRRDFSTHAQQNFVVPEYSALFSRIVDRKENRSDNKSTYYNKELTMSGCIQSVDAKIEYALGVMNQLMPHVNVERLMSEEQQVWLTFSSLVDGKKNP